MSLQTLRWMVGGLMFILGASFGSFFGVVIDRVPNGKSIGLARSECDHCHQPLPWYTMFPIVSYLFLKGECVSCHQKISIRYLFYEIIVGSLFLAGFLRYGIYLDWLTMIEMVVFWSMLFVVGVMDEEYMIINDGVLLVFSLILVVVKLLQGGSLLEMVKGFAVGFIFYLFIYFVAKWAYKKEAFGAGDVTFAGSLGIFLGPSKMFATAILSFYVCLVLYVLLYLKDRKSFKGEMPFGPAMCITAFVMSLYGEVIIHFFLRIMGFVE